MADCSKKIVGVTSCSPVAEHIARGVSEVARMAARKSVDDGQTCQERLPAAGKNLPAEIDDAILKLARVLARQAAREDHARQLARSAYHDETRGNLREIFHRPAE